MGLPNTHGALVADVTAGGPAAEGRPPQWRCDHRLRRQADRRFARIAAHRGGHADRQDREYRCLRKGKKQTHRIVIAKLDEGPVEKPGRKAPPPAPKSKSKLSQLGLSLVPLDENARAKYKLAGRIQGVVVSEVDPASPAADKNFRPGDVIVEVQNQAVKSPAEVEARLDAEVKAGKKVA